MQDEIMDLPACANDDEYAFVLRHLCNDGYMPSGPYLDEELDSYDWTRANTKKVMNSSPPSDHGQYD